MKMSTVNKAVLAALLTATLIGGARNAALENRINDLEGQRDIYASRLANWQDRAIRDEEIIDRLQAEEQTVLPGELIAEYAGEFQCTAYCIEKYQHICGEGHGITASGQPIQADVTVAADQALLPYGTVLYIEGVGVRVVQDKGAGVQGYHLDVAVDTHENALAWSGYGEHRVWIIREVK